VCREAILLAKKGASLEPRNQLVRALLAHVFFVSDQKELFFREAEESLLLNPNSPDVVCFVGSSMALYEEWERGLLLLERGMKLNPFYPGWFHLAPYLNYYRQGKFEEAYHEAEKFNAPQLFWDSLVRAAALGQLERGSEAKIAVDELLTLRPDFPACGQNLISFFIKSPRLVRIILEGLRKAGLELRLDEKKSVVNF